MLLGSTRFNDLRRGVPRMLPALLSKRLKELEHEGIVSRKVFPEVPVRVEYSLTEKGKAFRPIMEEIQKWAEKYMEVDPQPVSKR